MKLPVGLQLYSVRDKMEKDFEGTLKKVREIGYDFVEFAGLFDRDPADVKKLLDELALPAISAHIPLVDLESNLDKVIEDYKVLGTKFIVIPYLPEDMRPEACDFDAVLAKFDAIGAKLAENGMTLLYHNHDFEFVKMPNGQYSLDYMYENIPSAHLQTELDCCWVKVAGEEPAEYVKMYKNRCPVVHLKDFAGEKSDSMYELIGIDKKSDTSEANTFKFRPVGSGRQNFPEILAACEEAGASYVVVEQDQWYNECSLGEAEKSRNYLKTLGW